MNTHLLTWNPDRWNWSDLTDNVAAIRRGESVSFRWSAGNTTRIVPGDRLYILKQGRGAAVSSVSASPHPTYSESSHFDERRAAAGDLAKYIEGIWESLLDLDDEAILPLELLKDRVPGVHWTPPASGFYVPAGSASKLRTLWREHLRSLHRRRTFYPDEVTAPNDFTEGATRAVQVNVFERNPSARAACIAHYGAHCQVCKLDFERRYGEIGRGFIHVHHLKQLSNIRTEYVVDPVQDLRPVCPNCHAMLHQNEPPLTIAQLKRKLRS